MALQPFLQDNKLNVFRTRPCERLARYRDGHWQSGKCQFGSKCQYSHNADWLRRPPLLDLKGTAGPGEGGGRGGRPSPGGGGATGPGPSFRYVALYCPFIRIEGGKLVETTCTRSDGCPFAHSYEELIFHPLFYKTLLCPDHTHYGHCPRYYCHFAHSEHELRDPQSLADIPKPQLDPHLLSLSIAASSPTLVSPADIENSPQLSLAYSLPLHPSVTPLLGIGPTTLPQMPSPVGGGPSPAGSVTPNFFPGYPQAAGTSPMSAPSPSQGGPEERPDHQQQDHYIGVSGYGFQEPYFHFRSRSVPAEQAASPTRVQQQEGGEGPTSTTSSGTRTPPRRGGRHTVRHPYSYTGKCRVVAPMPLVTVREMPPDVPSFPAVPPPQFPLPLGPPPAAVSPPSEGYVYRYGHPAQWPGYRG
ncbi:unnamed protein product [Vitrella brassicaformis CCMP3155]|uniref:C3H1-type domain-containing protein n=2 Tax=Vitrella brassicaformis TaxID=1169539 RepID=A0A0G4EN74_VITBC|nr:unnamed protein product [Vitrella brassicaformis CCMP3155]|eukprot:CEL98479.1 unnamed protein product [Vitrella brassicaformis CCMP3155]